MPRLTDRACRSIALDRLIGLPFWQAATGVAAVLLAVLAR